VQPRERGVTADPNPIPPAIAPAPAPSPVAKSEENPQVASREAYFSGAAVPAPQASTASGGPRVWLLRVRALLLVTLCATFGVLLLILPWTPRWTDNPLLLGSAALREIISSGFVRGLASGLGLLNLWLGFREAIFYHENPKGSGQ
jgi:hypothetical protein